MRDDAIVEAVEELIESGVPLGLIRKCFCWEYREIKERAKIVLSALVKNHPELEESAARQLASAANDELTIRAASRAIGQNVLRILEVQSKVAADESFVRANPTEAVTIGEFVIRHAKELLGTVQVQEPDPGIIDAELMAE
jgi:hypothetical protein